jgi:hypothetical protein
MKIRFDHNLKVAGIGLVPWTRLGPEQWLANYKIASLYGWDMGVDAKPDVLALSDSGSVPVLDKQNTANLLKTQEFQSILEDDLAGYAFLPYKHAVIPPALAHRKFLMVDGTFTAQFENKAWFREHFSDKLNFPKFTVYNRRELQPSEESFDAVRAGREAFVLQDEQIGGGKGTFIIHSFADWQWALEGLAKISQHERVVVSSLVQAPRERTIQACVTKQGVFTGPLQRQFVAHPLLANLRVVDGDKFCGVQILREDQGTELHRQATEVAQAVGAFLAEAGYRGIFGVDFLLDENDELYVLEVNPRITGVTPLLATMFGDDTGLPFYLLHILELGEFDYEIIDREVTFDKDGALLVLHSPHDEALRIDTMPQSGTYELRNDQLYYIGSNISFDGLEPGQFVLQEYLPPDMIVRPGGRVMTMLWKEVLIDIKTDKWYNQYLKTIQSIQDSIKYKPVIK